MEDDQQIKEKFFAKLNGRRGEHLLVFSDEANMSTDALRRFSKPDLSHPIEFEPGRSLHPDEWSKITLDESQVNEMVQPYLDDADNSTRRRTVSSNDYTKVVGLYKTDGKTLLITKVTPGLRVESKTFLGLSEYPEMKTYEKAIEFSGQVDAYYENSNLYFKNYSKISTLFSGIEVFYRNATAVEKQDFLSKSFFEIENVDVDSIGMRDSHKIAAILDDPRIDLNDLNFQQKVLQYAQEFRPLIVSDEGKLKITDKKTLHDTLSVLTERYYKSELFGDKREAIDSTKLEL